MEIFSRGLDFFNPLRYFSQGEYVSTWERLFSTLLMGFWGRLFASLSLILAFWCGVVRQKVPLAIVFFSLTIVFAYFGGAVRIVFWWIY